MTPAELIAGLRYELSDNDAIIHPYAADGLTLTLCTALRAAIAYIERAERLRAAVEAYRDAVNAGREAFADPLFDPWAADPLANAGEQAARAEHLAERERATRAKMFEVLGNGNI